MSMSLVVDAYASRINATPDEQDNKTERADDGEDDGDAPSRPTYRTLKLRLLYGRVLFEDNRATLDDLREAVATLEDAGRIARRVLGGAHPLAVGIEIFLQKARAALRARETRPSPPPSESV